LGKFNLPLGKIWRGEEMIMKLFLFSLAATASLGLWMVSVASSQLALLDRAGTADTASIAYTNPVNRRLKQDRLDIATAVPLKTTVGRKGDFCDIGGFDRACKMEIAGLKVSPPSVITN